jgi:HEPN domain-containing protein
MSKNFKPPQEWLKQADYDLKTAESLFKTSRFLYTVFMCHLSIEKALKGFYAKKFQEDPPKIHNLNYLLEKSGIKLTEEFQDFIDRLNNLSVPTRYPDELTKILKDYKKDLTKKVLKQTKELLLCLKEKI